MDVAVLFVLVPVLVGVATLAAVGVVAVTLLRGGGREPGVAAAAHAAGSASPVGDDGLPVGQWQVQALPVGGWSPAHGFGRLRVEGGWVRFWPDDGGDGWQVPARELLAGPGALGLFGRSDVVLEHAALGRVGLAVSLERINRLMGNDLKRFRERGYARDCLQALYASGARPFPAYQG